MLTGFAGGYLLGCLVMLGLTFLFGILCAVNQYSGDMGKIYDADALDVNFEADTEPDNDNPTGDEKNGGRNNDSDTPGEAQGREHK